jgi:hypothetical protein
MNPLAWLNAQVNAAALHLLDAARRRAWEERQERQLMQTRESEVALRQLRAELRLMRRWRTEVRDGPARG